MSFVLFPSASAPACLDLVVGTNGLAPDERPLGRPGHDLLEGLRRRFAFLPVWPDAQVLEEQGASPRARAALQRLFSIFLEEVTDDAFALVPGHAHFLDGSEGADQLLRTGLAPLLREYLLQGYVSGFNGSRADQLTARSQSPTLEGHLHRRPGEARATMPAQQDVIAISREVTADEVCSAFRAGPRVVGDGKELLRPASKTWAMAASACAAALKPATADRRALKDSKTEGARRKRQSKAEKKNT